MCYSNPFLKGLLITTGTSNIRPTISDGSELIYKSNSGQGILREYFERKTEEA